MDEEDFFKDYPAADGSFDANASQPVATDTNPFVLAEDPTQPDATAIPEPNGSPSDSPGAPPSDADNEECAAVTQWRIQFAKTLEEKTTTERQVKTERADRAAATLSSMHARWESSRVQAQEVNRKSQTEFLRQRDAVISVMSKKGELPNWNVVPQLVDMSGRFKEGARDTSRMRQVLLRMKTTE